MSECEGTMYISLALFLINTTMKTQKLHVVDSQYLELKTVIQGGVKEEGYLCIYIFSIPLLAWS